MVGSEDKIIYLQTSDMTACSNPKVLMSLGCGSCVVITLYDSVKRVGAMAHPMLPLPPGRQALGSSREHLGSGVYRYVESAIDAMLEELTKLGAVKSRLEAKLVGGASMFKVFDKNPESIGAQNVEAAKRKLEKEGIKIVANDTGGSVGRSVAFDLVTGLVEIKTRI